MYKYMYSPTAHSTNNVKGREKEHSKEKGDANGVGWGQRQRTYLKYLPYSIFINHIMVINYYKTNLGLIANMFISM